MKPRISSRHRRRSPGHAIDRFDRATGAEEIHIAVRYTLLVDYI